VPGQVTAVGIEDLRKIDPVEKLLKIGVFKFESATSSKGGGLQGLYRQNS
jgi:hypothetical protein